MSKRTLSEFKVKQDKITHHNLDHDVDDDDDDVNINNKRAKSTQPSSINHYTGWKVPSDNYIIPTIRIGSSDDENNDISEYEKFTTDEGKPYYRNSVTGEVSWEIPES